MSVTQSFAYGSFAIDVLPYRAEVVVAVSGDLDLLAARHLEQEVRDLHSAGFAHDQVVLDLRRVSSLSFSGIWALVTLARDAMRAGRKLKAIPAPEDVQRKFELVDTRGLFDWRDH